MSVTLMSSPLPSAAVLNSGAPVGLGAMRVVRPPERTAAARGGKKGGKPADVNLQAPPPLMEPHQRAPSEYLNEALAPPRAREKAGGGACFCRPRSVGPPSLSRFPPPAYGFPANLLDALIECAWENCLPEKGCPRRQSLCLGPRGDHSATVASSARVGAHPPVDPASPEGFEKRPRSTVARQAFSRNSQALRKL